MLFANRSLKMTFEKDAKQYKIMENVIMCMSDFMRKLFKSIRTYGHQKVKKGAARLSVTSSKIKISTVMATLNFFKFVVEAPLIYSANVMP